jgi:putative ABC transport system permease protein
VPNLILFYRLIVRPLRREPVRTSLTAAAVALGVAVVLAIELAGGAAAGSFRASVESLTGEADFEITATGGVPARVLAQIEALPYAFQARPRIEDYAEIAGANRTVPLIGVDLLSGSPAGGTGSGSAADFQRDDSIWVGDGLGYKAGDSLKLLLNDTTGNYIVRGVLGKGSGDVMVMDLAPATRVLGRNGSLDRILLTAPPGRSIDAWEGVLRKALPNGVTVARQGTRTNENRRMLQAFRWNLRALSYIALVVGAFLIYNTISVSVVRRRAEIGIVRAVGAQRSQVLLAFLGEAGCFGLLGGLVGVALGRLMAVGALKLVASTVESLYVSSRPGPITLTWELGALACAAGIGVAVVSALAPAWEAARVAPLEAMARGRREHQARMHKMRGLLLAAVLAAAAWLASRQPAVDGEPIFGYLATVLLIAASTLAIPALVAVLASVSAPLLGRVFGVEAMLASRSLAGSLRRTSVLVGALSTAIAMMVAVGIMVGSFRETVLVWMGDRLQADIYLRPAVPQATDRHPTMSPDVIERLQRVPQVAAIDPFRAYDISYQGWPAILGAGDSMVAAKYSRRPFLSGEDPKRESEQLTSGDNAIVSEPFANKHHVHRGDVLELSLAGRRVRFTVVGIYYDYSSERGYIIVDRSTLLKYLPDPAPSNVAVYLKPGVPVDTGRRAVEAALAGRKVLALSNRTLRDEAIRIFDRTFAITYALEAIAVFVAVMGIVGALLALVIDRRREFGLLRFLGGATGQLRRMILFEAGLLGLLSNVAGLFLGVFLSLLLIYVINKQSFGWTIQFHWPTAMLLVSLTLVYVATVIAGLYPARMATRLNPIEVVHEE